MFRFQVHRYVPGETTGFWLKNCTVKKYRCQCSSMPCYWVACVGSSRNTTSRFSQFALCVTSYRLSKNYDTTWSMPPTFGIYGASCLNDFARNQRGTNDNELTNSFNCHGSYESNSTCQRFAGNAELRPASRAPGMDMRAGELIV